MLTLNQLAAIAEADGVNVTTVERDYVFTHFIEKLSGLDAASALTFKGGTALRMVHFQTFRYSADIDLNVNLDLIEPDAALYLIIEAAELVARDVGLSITVDEGVILYTGPRNQAVPEKVKLDIASDEMTTDQPIRQPIIHRYPDQSDVVSLPSYGLVEVAAEKLRCVIQRLQCRDLFDIHRLFAGEGVDVDDAWNQFTFKAGHRDLDPRSLPGRWQARIEAYEKRWDKEMRRYTGEVPPFEKILRESERALRPALRT